ncbi:Bax inhibitor-1/YccA family protein [Undibacterium crateris]|nr:Bax inhibitor-1/YccA family protein [Undibacterium crateris]NDI85189.1 BAX inhibitor (BI)-1/YccA family protein [Undibacterium crateris]
MKILSRSTARDVQSVDYTDTTASDSHKVLRNTYMLLSMTLLFSALTAGLSVAFAVPGPGIIITLVAYFGLLFAVTKLRNSGWGIAAVFALTGFLGYTLGPILSVYLKMPGGSSIVMTAMGLTGLIFMGLSAYVLVSKRDFSFMGGFLMAGMIVALVASLGAIFFQIPALSLAISGVMVLLMSGMILFETSNIIRGGETNYIMATVSLYITIFNLFTSLLQLLGFMEKE